MSRKAPASPHAPATAPRRTGILSILTPLNVALLTLLIGGFVAIGYTQFADDKPIPALPTEPPAPITIPPPPATTSATPASAPSPIADRMSIMPAPNPPTPVWEGIADGSTLPLFQNEPPTRGLAPPAAGTRKPVNSMDLFTGKPVGFGAPSTEYKGYSIGFCCNQSVGYNGSWERLSEAEKDTYVRHFLK